MLLADDRVSYLLNVWSNQAATIAEEEELFEWINTSANELLVRQHIEQLVDEYKLATDLPLVNWEKLYARIEEKRQRAKILPDVSRVHFLDTNWFRYAAAVILILGTLAYLWTATKTKQPLAGNNNPQKTDIPPGRDRAILTLANGRQIVLDSAQGNIVKQGNLTVVNLAGKLKYEGIGAASEYNTISTPKGGQYQITLPDGSKVWLNAASSIKFPTAFTDNVRKVEMTGEAYMEIEKNPQQSFIVKTNGTEIQVLGTSFNINAYSDENDIRTTLISGSVKVVSNTANGIILKPGQQASINHSENAKIQKILIQTADIEQTLAWKNGVFLLDHAKLAEIMRQLARWYDVEVIYEREVPNIELGGKMARDLTLSQMLDGLGGLGVKFRMEGKRLIIL